MAAVDIDHAGAGTTASAMPMTEVRGLIEREGGHYALTDTGGRCFACC